MTSKTVEVCIICAKELTIFTRGVQSPEEIYRLKITFCDMMGLSGTSTASDLLSHDSNPFCIHCIRPIIATQKAIILFRLKMGISELKSPQINGINGQGLPEAESSSAAVESNIAIRSKSPSSSVKAPEASKPVPQPLSSLMVPLQPSKKSPKPPTLVQMMSGLNDIEIVEIGSDDEDEDTEGDYTGAIKYEKGLTIEFIGDSEGEECEGMASIEVKKEEIEEEGAEGSKNESKIEDYDSDSTDSSDVETSDSGDDDPRDEDYSDNYQNPLEGQKRVGKTFSCRFCGDEFRRREGLVRHEKLHTKGQKKFSEGVLLKSNGDQMDRKDYECSVCSRVFYSQALLDKHTDQEHAQTPNVPLTPSKSPSTLVSGKCSICEKPYIAKETQIKMLIRNHEATHDPSSYFQCPVCPIKRDILGYSTKSHMLRHIRFSHPESNLVDLEALFQAPEMPNLIPSVTEPSPDEDDEGSSPKKCIKMNCGLCKKNFRGIGYLKRHMNLVHGRKST